MASDRVSAQIGSRDQLLTLVLRVAATIYHLFLSEDNSPELFAQAKRIHNLIPYAVLKNVIRLANPAAMMKGVLDLFLARPLGSKSLMQPIFGMAIHDSIRQVQKTIDVVAAKVDDPILVEKIQAYTEADEELKEEIRQEAEDQQLDLIVAVLRSEQFSRELTGDQIQKVYNAWVAFNSAVENVSRQESL